MADRYTPSILLSKKKIAETKVEPETQPSLLKPDLVERIKRLMFLARSAVDGALSGFHRSFHLGQSIEFSQHKEYSQGDDLKDLDWKAYAKSDRFFIKQYETETNTKSIILIDASNSMNFGTTGVTKYEYSRILACALSFIFLNQFDEAGIISTSGNGIKFLSPGRGRIFLKTIAEHLVLTEPCGSSDLVEAMGFLSGKLWRGISIIISDLLADEERIVKEIKYLRHRRNDCVVLQVLDPAELHFNFNESGLFKGLEDDGEITTDPGEIRGRYIEELMKSINFYRKNFRINEIYYMLVETSTPIEKVLSDILTARLRSAI